jgi:hypothetical protein
MLDFQFLYWLSGHGTVTLPLAHRPHSGLFMFSFSTESPIRVRRYLFFPRLSTRKADAIKRKRRNARPFRGAPPFSPPTVKLAAGSRSLIFNFVDQIHLSVARMNFQGARCVRSSVNDESQLLD